MVYYICIPKNLETIVSRFLLEAPTRFELVIEVLQTFALPLGYGTKFNCFLKGSDSKGI